MLDFCNVWLSNTVDGFMEVFGGGGGGWGGVVRPLAKLAWGRDSRRGLTKLTLTYLQKIKILSQNGDCLSINVLKNNLSCIFPGLDTEFAQNLRNMVIFLRLLWVHTMTSATTPTYIQLILFSNHLFGDEGTSKWMISLKTQHRIVTIILISA